MQTTGQELRDEREFAELTQEQLAARMRVNRTTVLRAEQRARVKPDFARRYREALRESATEQGAA